MIFGWQHLGSTVLGITFYRIDSFCEGIRRSNWNAPLVWLKQKNRLATCMLLAICLKSSTKFWSSMNEQFSVPRFFERSIYSMPRWDVHHARKGPSEGKTSESAVNLANRSTKLWDFSAKAAKISVCRWCETHTHQKLWYIVRHCNTW